MSDAGPIAELTIVDTEHLSLFQKTVTLISWGLAVALFLTVGPRLFLPDPPAARVSHDWVLLDGTIWADTLMASTVGERSGRRG